MSQAFGTFQKLAQQNKTQKSPNPVDNEQELLTDPKTTLSLAQNASGEAMQHSVMQLQRTIGNQAVGELLSQRSAPHDSVQREIAKDGSGMPVLATYFDDAFNAIASMVEADSFARFKTKLAADHPVKNKTFMQAWALKTVRPSIRQAAAAEFSAENIDFLTDVETYKESPSVDKAVQIYNQYISTAAPTQVNLSDAIRLTYDDANAVMTAAPATRGRR